MKNYLKNGWPLASLPKLDLRMKLSLLMLFTTLLSLNAKEGYSQRTKLSLDVENATVKQIIDEIETTTEFKFIYKTKDVNLDRKTTIKVHKVEIEKILNRLFEATDTEYLVRDRQILLRAKKEIGLNDQAQMKINDIAQQWVNVSGMVTDGAGVPLTGVTIMAVGTSTGVSTDFEGKYSIRVSGDVKELSFSYLGYKTQVIVLADVVDLTALNVSMTEEASKLEEVVVFADGYTEISEERATGSYGTISDKMLNNYATQSVGSMLEGVSPGIQVLEDADGNVNIEDVTIRGVGSIDSNATPLVVVDGFPISGGFNTVNPNIIESITVLKDAAAASIWGARASNGVIVITTKKDKGEQKLSVNFNTFVRTRNKMDLDYTLYKASAATEIEMDRFNFQDSRTAYWIQYMSFPNTLPQNAGAVYTQAGRAFYDFDRGVISQAELDATINRLKGKDVYDDIDRYLLNSPLNKQYNLQVSSGGDKSSSMVSVMYNDNIGAFINDENEQLLINVNNSFKITNWAELQVGLVVDRSKSKSSGVDLQSLEWLNRYDQIFDDNGDYFALPAPSNFLNLQYAKDFTANTIGLPYDDLTWNPLREARATEFANKQKNFRVSTALNIDITKDIRLVSSFQYEDFVNKNTALYEEDSYYARYEVTNSINRSTYNATTNTVGAPNIPKGGIKETTNGEMESYVVRNTLAYDKTFGTDHKLNAFGGFELSSFENNSNSNTLYGYNDKDNSFAIPAYTGWTGLFNGDAGTSYGVGLTETYQRYLSYFGNFAYTYNNKYTLTGSARNDGANIIVDSDTSRFNPMWSLGLGWNIKRESFMEGADFLDVWRLRGTVGENGNIVGGASQVPVISITNSPSTFLGSRTGRILDKGNPALRWERTRVLNLGTDFSIFNGVLSGSFDYYKKRSYDLIARVTIASTLGSTVQSFNAADMENNGYEINLNANIDIAKDLNWFSNLSFAHNDNITTTFNGGRRFPRNLAGGAYDYVEGYAYMPLFSFVYGGIQDFERADGTVYQYPTVEGLNGKTYRWDENIGSAGEDGVEVTKYEGTRIAPTVVGWNNTISFKGLTLRARMIGKFGHKFSRPGGSYATWGARNQISYGSYPGWEQMLSGEAADEGYPSLPSVYDFNTYRWGWYSPYLDTRVEDAAHIRLRELYLGYDLPANMLDRLGMTNLRIFTQVENLGNIWTANDHGIDPEYLIGQVRRPETSFTLGINLQF